MMAKEELLKKHFLLEGAPEALPLLLRGETASFARGEEIYGERNYRRALGIVLSGAAAAETVSGGGAALRRFPAGATFGAAAIFREEGAFVSRITALSACEVLFLTEAELTELFTAYPRASLNYIRFLTSRIRYLNGEIALFTGGSAAARLYEYLRREADGEGRLPEKLNMTRLAAALDIGRTSLYRALDELEKNGHLRREPDGLRLL